MKRSTTQTVSKTFVAQATAVAMAVLLAGAGAFHLGSSVLARDYDAEIRAKESEAQQYGSEADRLGQVATTLQGALDEISAQVGAIQAQIAESQQKHDNLVAEIAKNEELMQANRDALGEILSDLYIDDQISPLEILASSDTIGDYIDKQEQRSSLKQSLNDKIKYIKELKLQLENDKKSVENVLKDQESQRQHLASKQAEQAKLVSDTKNDQNAYSTLATERNAEAAKLREEQIRANRVFISSGYVAGTGPTCGGSYPAKWCNIGKDTAFDDWGMYNRECVSYAAFKVWSSGRHMPYWGGIGNAYEWDDNARRANIPVNGTPVAGAIGQTDRGPYGHVFHVDSVNADGTINISQYNAAFDGTYSVVTGMNPSGYNFIHF